MALVLALTLSVRAAPRLSEFLADNASVIQDDEGNFTDYIEIYNPDTVPVDLAGYSLTDDPVVAQRWVFPTTILQPGGHLLIWASGKNRTAPKLPLHTNFQIEKNGGYLAFFAPGGIIPLTVYAAYPVQEEDRSYGNYQAETRTALVSVGAACHWKIPTAPEPGWESPGFAAVRWSPAKTGIGFDTDGVVGGYTALFGAGGDLAGAMPEINATAFLRVPFQVTQRNNMSGLTLRMKCDDGFVAWINGARVASRYAPDDVTWNSTAISLTDDEDALNFESIGIPNGLGSLRDGTNILAIQLLNGEVDNPDTLLVPELELNNLDTAQPLTTGYFQTPTPAASNTLAESGFTADTKFDVDRGFFTDPFNLTISCATPGVTIYYTTDGSLPGPRTALIYTAPISIGKTTIVRAMADGDARHPSNVDTQTYLFPAGIVRQSSPTGYPATWGSLDDGFGGLTPIPADYGMDQSVVNDARYAGLTEQGLRNSLPVVSLATSKELLFSPAGIYANGRDGSDEAPVSMELFGPGLPKDLQIDAGVRIHGGNARSHPKKPFRLYFRKSYGTDKLRFPLFGDSPVQKFDQLILRPGGHDGWSVPFGNESTMLAFHASYVRDQFLRRTESDMGRLSPLGRYVHLYLNGLYWGVYDLHERANADYYASHLGGQAEDWDVVHHPSFAGEDYSQVDGVGTAWEKMLKLADDGIRSRADYDAISALLDVDDYIDSLIVRIWSGDYDWCGPIFIKSGTTEAEAGYFDNKNWYSARRSRGEPGGFLFHVWDAEMSMGTHLMQNLGNGGQPAWLAFPPPQRIATFDGTRVGTKGSVTWPYAAIRSYPPFRQKFGDHLQKHFFGKGILTTIANQARLDSLTSQLELPIVAESARWGDVNRFDPTNLTLTRDTHWKPEIAWMRNTFMAGRNALILNQFQATGLFPATAAPLATPESGAVAAGTPLGLSSPGLPGASIYYTLDGSEPTTFSPTVSRTLLEEGDACQWWVPSSSIGISWRSFAGPANPTLWRDGANGIGYDQETTYLPFFRTDVNAAMRNTRASIYFRMEFSMASQAEIDALSAITLLAQYDDGFIAAINGTVVQRANAPTNESYTSISSTVREDAAAVLFAPFILNTATVRPLLRVGRNVLAIQGLNQSASSSDFLCTVRLFAQSGGQISAAPGALLFNSAQPPVIAGNTTVKARSLNAGEWSALKETNYLSGVPASAANMVPSQIHYRPAPPVAAEIEAGFTDESDFEYLELLNTSSDPVDLSGCHFSNGLVFDFDAAAIKQIPPGGRLLVVRRTAALSFRYPAAALSIAGTFAEGSGLSNSGERLRLQAADGRSIFDLTYQDNSPWPGAADGEGPALVLTNPRGLNQPANPRHWRSGTGPAVPGQSDTPGFSAWLRSVTPAGTTTLPGPLEDPDQDTGSNLMEYASGTLPFDATSVPTLTIIPNGTSNLLAFQINPEAPDAALVLEEAATLAGAWVPAKNLGEIPGLSGRNSRQYETPIVRSAGRSFFRLRATLP